MSAVQASPTAKGSRPRDPVRAVQHVLYRAAKANPGRRFHTLSDKFYRKDVLRRVGCGAENNGAPGDHVTLAEVEEYGVDRLLDELASELKDGRYRPMPARRVLIPKSGMKDQYRPFLSLEASVHTTNWTPDTFAVGWRGHAELPGLPRTRPARAAVAAGRTSSGCRATSSADRWTALKLCHDMARAGVRPGRGARPFPGSGLT